MSAHASFSAAALPRPDYTFDQLPSAIRAAELKAEEASKATREAARWAINPGAGYSRKHADRLAREATARAQRFTAELSEMLAVIAAEQAERVAAQTGKAA